jgi:DnaA family protein
MKQLPLGVQLRAQARFDTVIAGHNARPLAHVRALAGADAPSVTWLWGEPATGKTHWLQAACVAAHDAGKRAGYVPLGEPGIDTRTIEGWEALDLVCADDLHRVAGDGAWERALFTLHNGLIERGGALLAAADRSPATLAFALPDLASRLRAAAVFRLVPLDDAGCLEALQAHARARGLELPAETARYLLRRTPRDMHSLCGTLERLDSASLAAQRRLTVPFVRELLDASGP